jgi:hypothetical protein
MRMLKLNQKELVTVQGPTTSKNQRNKVEAGVHAV